MRQWSVEGIAMAHGMACIGPMRQRMIRMQLRMSAMQRCGARVVGRAAAATRCGAGAGDRRACIYICIQVCAYVRMCMRAAHGWHWRTQSRLHCTSCSHRKGRAESMPGYAYDGPVKHFNCVCPALCASWLAGPTHGGHIVSPLPDRSLGFSYLRWPTSD